jgi:aspartate 1-decarboxylase
MLRQLLKAKIHRATVTEANINYEGSFTIDESLMEAADIVEHEKVLIANLTTGARLESYAIKGKRGSGVMCANGGAAIHCKVSDIVLIMSFCVLNEEEVKRHHPTVIRVDSRNRILS